MFLLTFLFRKVLQVIGGAADKVKILSVIFLTTNCHFCFVFFFIFPAMVFLRQVLDGGASSTLQ